MQVLAATEAFFVIELVISLCMKLGGSRASLTRWQGELLPGRALFFLCLH